MESRFEAQRRHYAGGAGGGVWLLLMLTALPTRAQDAPLAAEYSTSVACVLRGSHGLPEADARTAALLVCEALRAAGAQVDTEPAASPGNRAAYEVATRTLGALVILQVSFRSAAGQLQRTETLQLNRIEEIPVGAKRLADAMLHRKRVEATANVDNLVGEDTRRALRRPGATSLALGLLGFVVAGGESNSGFGALGRLQFEMASFAGGIEARLAGSGKAQGDTGLIGLALGGRWFLLQGNLTPFLGAGVGLSWLATDDERGNHLRGSGLAPYLELGLELMRLYASRMNLLVRVDVPTYELEREKPRKAVYLMPVSLMASYSFN